MKVLKIEPKNRLTDYTHIEIQGITIPIKDIAFYKTEDYYIELNIWGPYEKHILRFALKDRDSVDSVEEQLIIALSDNDKIN